MVIFYVERLSVKLVRSLNFLEHRQPIVFPKTAVNVSAPCTEVPRPPLHVSRSAFRQERKKDPKTLLNRPIGQYMKLEKIQKSQGTVKMVIFDVENIKTLSFSRYLFETSNTCTPDNVLSNSVRFLKIGEFSCFF